MQQRLLSWSDAFVKKEAAVSEQETPASFFQSIYFPFLFLFFGRLIKIKDPVAFVWKRWYLITCMELFIDPII